MSAAQAPAPALRRIDAALDVVLDALMRVLAECYLRRLDLPTRSQAQGALTRLFLALAGRPERDTALDQANTLAFGQPMPSAETVAGWIRGWEAVGERLFPAASVAGGVTTRANVAPPMESLPALQARVERLRGRAASAPSDETVDLRELDAAEAELAPREAALAEARRLEDDGQPIEGALVRVENGLPWDDDVRVFQASEWPVCVDCGERHPRGTAHREAAPVAEEPAVSGVVGEARS